MGNTKKQKLARARGKHFGGDQKTTKIRVLCVAFTALFRASRARPLLQRKTRFFAKRIDERLPRRANQGAAPIALTRARHGGRRGCEFRNAQIEMYDIKSVQIFSEKLRRICTGVGLKSENPVKNCSRK
jgi:hypothetical protein